ncbi:MAG: hypothetical protein JSS72_10980 [Armatimonadetes bacterium]|nr:hypothetical protein [Armatimonadota bacterium]
MNPQTCLEARNELFLYTLAQPRPPFIHQLAVDAYSAQHLRENATPITKLFPLMGLFMVCEQGATGLEVQMAHKRKAGDVDRKNWPNPPIHPSPFLMNVGDVLRETEGLDRDRAIHKWVVSTWASYAYIHDIIRAFCS